MVAPGIYVSSIHVLVVSLRIKLNGADSRRDTAFPVMNSRDRNASLNNGRGTETPCQVYHYTPLSFSLPHFDETLHNEKASVKAE